MICPRGCRRRRQDSRAPHPGCRSRVGQAKQAPNPAGDFEKLIGKAASVDCERILDDRVRRRGLNTQASEYLREASVAAASNDRFLDSERAPQQFERRNVGSTFNNNEHLACLRERQSSSDRVIESNFDQLLIGKLLLQLAEGENGVENVIGYAAIVAKARRARLARHRDGTGGGDRPK
jgi:hypothetical protein